jgi:hypothetical protein
MCRLAGELAGILVPILGVLYFFKALAAWLG